MARGLSDEIQDICDCVALHLACDRIDCYPKLTTALQEKVPGTSVTSRQAMKGFHPSHRDVSKHSLGPTPEFILQPY